MLFAMALVTAYYPRITLMKETPNMSQEYIIDVDENWIDKDGNDYRLFTADEPVDKGYMLNTPQRVRLPNGDIEIGNRIEVTPKGLEWLNEVLPDDIRNDALAEAETLCPSTTIQ